MRRMLGIDRRNRQEFWRHFRKRTARGRGQATDITVAFSPPKEVRLGTLRVPLDPQWVLYSHLYQYHQQHRTILLQALFYAREQSLHKTKYLCPHRSCSPGGKTDQNCSHTSICIVSITADAHPGLSVPSRTWAAQAAVQTQSLPMLHLPGSQAGSPLTVCSGEKHDSTEIVRLVWAGPTLEFRTLRRQ